jgi:hypothetical protein
VIGGELVISPPMAERSIQLLACQFHISTDAEEVFHRLDRIRMSAIQDHPVLRRHRLHVRREADGYRVLEDDDGGSLVVDADEAGALVERRLHELAVDALADHTKLHAGTATWHGRRFLVVGGRGAGKTTLMTRLLFEGCSVEGDEMVLMRDGSAVAFPRRFGIRPRTLRLVPEVGALVPELRDAPGSDEPGGYHVLALDPDQLGLTWHIGTGPISVIFLVRRHEGATRLTPCPTPVVLQRLMEQSVAPRGGTAAWIRDLSALVRGACAYELAIGDLDSVVAVVRQCLTHAARRAAIP